jgi:hypothetical protein
MRINLKGENRTENEKLMKIVKRVSRIGRNQAQTNDMTHPTMDGPNRW